MCEKHHSVSLAAYPHSKPQPRNFFLSTQAQKNLNSPRKNPDNSNMLQMFNNNIYTDYRTAYKTHLNF